MRLMLCDSAVSESRPLSGPTKRAPLRVSSAIAWRAVEREQFITDNRTSLDLAFSLDHNRYQGNEYLELSVSDFRTLGRA